MIGVNGAEGTDQGGTTATTDAAIVIGGSMAGLLAARVLTDHFGSVTVIDRDRFPTRPEFRKGVPQSRHAHVLLARGQDVIEELFPGIVDELIADGALPLETPADFLALTRFGWGPRYRPGLRVLSMSRELLEFHVRRRLAMSTVVRLVEATDVIDLVVTGNTVSGVRVRSRGGLSGAPKDQGQIFARLVIDASGRDSDTPAWLGRLGYDVPRETKIVSKAAYASRYYAEPNEFTADWKVLFFFPSPDLPRGGVLFPLEGKRWLVTLIGIGGDYPPTDEAGFLEFASTLRSPMLHNVIQDASPVSTIHGYRRTENVRRHYETGARRPEGLVVLGDAACAFNPIYGQGMTVAAIEAQALARQLATADRSPSGSLAGRVQKVVAQTNAVAWRLATSADLQYSTTEGARPGRLNGLLGRYMERLQLVTTRDATVAAAFRKVTQLLIPPSALLAPQIAVRVLAPRRILRRERPPTKTPFGA
jgi:flavin-dependent dehydrogenase